MQRALHARRLLLPAAGERRAPGAGWGLAGRGPGRAGGPWVSVRVCRESQLGVGGGWAGVTERTGGACSCWPGWLFVCAPRQALPGPRVRPARGSPPRPPAPCEWPAEGLWLAGAGGVCPGLLGGDAEVPAGCFPLDSSVASGSPFLGGLCPC